MESRVDQLVDHLSDLPKDFLDTELKKQLSISGLISFPQTARCFRLFFPVEHHDALGVLRKLLGHGVLGELDHAEGIWRISPDLLTLRGTIFFPNRSYKGADGKPLSQPVDIPFYVNPGRPKSTNRTFYQILLRNSEFEAAAKVGELMTPEEKQKQFLEIFPDGKIKKYNFDLEKAKSLLQVFFDQLVKDEKVRGEYVPDNMGDSTKEALYAIYDYAKLQLDDETGLLFDPNFIYEAMKLYAEKAIDQFKGNWGKYNLWCIRVEEWLKACSGTGFLRSLLQGLANPLTGLGCTLVDDSSYFAFRRASNSIPAFHFLVGISSRQARSAAGAQQWRRTRAHFFET